MLLIGSGPIIIGQAAEFDYAGTQACRVLKENGIEIVLVNSNPATIMTDRNMADKIYIEPLTLETVRRIIAKERPDGILSGLGGQTGLTLSMKLSKDGTLDKYQVRLLGSSPETIDKAEDRKLFKETMESIGEPVIPSVVTEDIDGALAFAGTNGYPLIVRPAFTLGGSGGGVARDQRDLCDIVANGLAVSPISQVLVERSIAGWKEIEFEVMRDRAGNGVIVCSMENFDPVGVHTGDSIVIAPVLTLADREYQMLRTAALHIIDSLGVEGGCNCQLALNPHSFEYAVIEVNPRVSRSSALASKATGYPIAKVATNIAIGYTLDEIPNAVTGSTFAAFEPVLDYVAVKLPKWPFDKFVYAENYLGTQMKATGEVMAMADTFEEALLKAVRGAELGLGGLELPRLKQKSREEIGLMLGFITDERLFLLYEALLRGFTVEDLHGATQVDRWFLHGLDRIRRSSADQKPEDPGTGKNLVYKMVDTCGGEFSAETPYFYSLEHGEENEVLPFIEGSKKQRVIVLGSGPIRIGQGIEFDYASVHCVWTLRSLGYEAIVINNNPETVSTDFDTADRLYFEPICADDVMRIIEVEKPLGCIVSFGGGTAIKLALELARRGVPILGTSAESIDICEDRQRFDALMEELGIHRPRAYTGYTEQEALAAAERLGYPVLLRPSYVLGGQNMIIAWTPDDIKEYMKIILRNSLENPVLIDKYIEGTEIEVDAISDGERVFIPGIMEQIERTGVHSGDSIAVYPPLSLDDELKNQVFEITQKICRALSVRGLINIQFVLHQGLPYVIEVNPRASRTVPYLSKITGIPMCDLAVRTSMGEKLSSQGIAKDINFVAVKVPVFSFEKLIGLDTHLGPEMKSTGEVLGMGRSLSEALYKGLLAAGYRMNKTGGVLITVTDKDKKEIAPVAERFHKLGFDLYATWGTARYLSERGLPVQGIEKIHQSAVHNTSTLLQSGKISYVVSTSDRGRDPSLDDVKIRRKACMLGISCMTSLDTANALIDSLMSGWDETNTDLVELSALHEKK